RLTALGRGLHHFLFRAKDLSAILINEHSHNFAHTPAGFANQAQAARGCLQQRDYVIANNSHGSGIALKSLYFEAGQVDSLELLGGIRHANRLDYCLRKILETIVTTMNRLSRHCWFP